MLDKRILRAMAEAERMMDEGKLPFVMAPSPRGLLERFALTPQIMEDFGLEQGQTINTIIRDAIIEYNLQRVLDDVSRMSQDIEDAELDEEFDFRDFMDDEGDEDATRH